MKSMPPPQPWALPLEERVKVSSSKVRVVLDPPPFVPVTYVAKTPISNSFPLKNETGGGGGGAITCFEDTIGSPAKIATACDAIVTTAKTIIFFINVMLYLALLVTLGRAGDVCRAADDNRVGRDPTRGAE